MTEARKFTPEEIDRLAREAKDYFDRLEADARRAILTVKAIHPKARCTIVVRVEGDHAVVVTEDDIGEVVAAIYKTYAITKN